MKIYPNDDFSFQADKHRPIVIIYFKLKENRRNTYILSFNIVSMMLSTHVTALQKFVHIS